MASDKDNEHHELREERRRIMNGYRTAAPYLRLGMAFLIYVRFGGTTPQVAYAEADTFLQQLTLDLAEQDGTE